MEADCSLSECLSDKRVNEQMSNNSIDNEKIATTINGVNIKQLLTMHLDDKINNDIVIDKLFENLSFHSENTTYSGSENDVDEPYKIIFVVLFCLLIVIVIIGNTLVILSVLTTRRLRTVTNLFVTSLALADWLVGIFVMPPAVAYYLMGS